MINLIWAMDINWLVGKDNLLPWHYPKDLKHFKNVTNNKTVLMGYNTYLSMKGYYKNTPFPFKKVYVANFEDVKLEDATIITDVITFLNDYKDELFVIGGPTIYGLAMPFADRLFITYILDNHDGNVYFKKFDLNKFRVTEYTTSNKLIFATYERKEI